MRFAFGNFLIADARDSSALVDWGIYGVRVCGQLWFAALDADDDDVDADYNDRVSWVYPLETFVS